MTQSTVKLPVRVEDTQTTIEATVHTDAHELATLETFEQDFRSEERKRAEERALKSMLANGFTVDESVECTILGCTCSRNHA